MMTAEARYYRDCIRGALGTLPGTPRPNGAANEPLGKRYGLSPAQAEEYAADAWAMLEAAGVTVLPRAPYNQKRLANVYAKP